MSFADGYQRVAGDDLVLVPSQRALVFEAPLEVEDDPDAALLGAVGGEGQVVGVTRVRMGTAALDALIAAAVATAMEGIVTTSKLDVSKTLVGNSATVAVPLFRVTGSVRVVKLYGIVTTVLGNNVTAAAWRLYDQTVSRDITLASGTALSSLLAGSTLVKIDGDSVALAALSSSTARVGGSAVVGAAVSAEFYVVQKAGANTDIEFRYTTSSTPTSGVIKFFVEYEALSSDGALVAQ